MPATISELLKSTTSLWKEQVQVCRKDKKEKFGRTASRLWDFLGKRYRNITFVIDEDGADDFPHLVGPHYKPVLNKSREFVNLYLPYVHAKVPNRLVRARRPELPPELAALGLERPDVKQAELIQSFLLQWWLNYLPTEYDAYTEQRCAIQEGLVKGRGVVWHELIAGPYGDIPGSFHVSVDELLIDADAKKMRDAGFIIRERWEPCYQVAEDYGIDVDLLRGQGRSRLHEAQEAAEESNPDDDDQRRKGDLCKLYEVYSRIGIGHRLVGAGDDDDLKTFGEILDETGPHVRLVICPDIEYPLNLKPDDVEVYGSEQEQREFVRQQLAWPIPFFEEFSNPWPCSCFDPYPNPDDAWATSPLEAGLPIQEYLDKAYNYVMSRVRRTCRDLIIYSAALEKSVEDGIHTELDLGMIKCPGKPGVDLKDLLEIVSFPDIKGDVWKVIAMLERAFERATGMDPLLYGSTPDSPQLRSAQEAGIREAHVTSRPRDIAEAVEEWNSKIAAKEAQATRLSVDASTVAPLFSEPEPPRMEGSDIPDYAKWVQGPLTLQWMQLVQTDDPARAAAEMHYTVEAGSGRRKNKQWQQDLAQQIVPPMLPIATQWANGGMPKQYNALVEMLAQAYEAPLEQLKINEEDLAKLQQMMAAAQAAEESQNAPSPTA